MAIRYELATVDDLAVARDGIAVYATLAALHADLTPSDGELARVTRDAANNGIYVKAGGAGAGSWQPYAYDRVAMVERQVGSAAASVRRYPFAPFASHTVETTQNDMFRGILDVQLYGAAPGYDVAVERIYRNYLTEGQHNWYISIVRTDTSTEIARFWTSSNPEPSDPNVISEHELTEPSGANVVGRIIVRWGQMTAGVRARDAYGMALDRDVWRPLNAPGERAESTFTVRAIASTALDAQAQADAAAAAVGAVERDVDDIVGAGGAHAIRRGLTGLSLSHPFDAEAQLAEDVSLGGLTPEELLSAIERGIVDIALYNTNPAETYYLERARRNASGGWFIRVSRASDDADVAILLSATSVEPSDPTQVAQHRLTNTRSDDGYAPTGFVWIRWSALPPGNNNQRLGLQIASTARRGSGGERSVAARMPSLYALQGYGQVILADPGSTFGFRLDGSVLEWDQFVIVDPLGHTGRARVSAGSVVLDANYGVAWLDLEAARTVNTAPASAVKVGTWFGDTPNDFRGHSHQIPLAIQDGTGGRFLSPWAQQVASRFGAGPGPTPPGSAYSTDEVVVQVTGSGAVDIYMRATGEGAESGRYVLYRLARYTASHADTWTIQGAWEATRNGGQSFTQGKEICGPAGEWICAIRELGKPDYMGGRAHGYETTRATPTLLLDGREVGLSSSGWHRARELVFVQRTSMWEQGELSLSTLRAHRSLWLTAKNGSIRARQRIEFQSSFTVQTAFLGMLPIRRYEVYTSSSEDPTSAQISGYYVNDVDFEVIDCTARTTDPIDYVSGVRRLRAWGDYGTGGEVEILEYSGPTNAIRGGVQNTVYHYNKGYLGFIDNENVEAGDVWTADTRWRLTAP